MSVSIGLVACGHPPALSEVEGKTFSSVADFQESISCGEHFATFPHWSEPPLIEDEATALELAESLLNGPHPDVVHAVKAGAVWLLVDEEGYAFAAMESVGASISGCVGY